MSTDVVISGIGFSKIGRKLDASGMALTLDAAIAALADAGLDRSDIDGLSTYPGGMNGDPFSPVGGPDLKAALGLELNWYSGAAEGGAQFVAFFNAYAAIKAGLARHVMCFRTVKEGTGGASWAKTASAATERRRVDGEYQWLLPFNSISATNWIAPAAMKHFHLYGTTREQLAQVALNGRRNAALNPNAVFQTPLAMDDYLGARMISTPLCLFDCDPPTDGSTVIILSSAEAARDLKQKPIRIESVGTAARGNLTWDQAELPWNVAFDSAASLWSRTDLKPADVDVAELYDGFSFLTLIWLEALGFCGVGESGAFVEGGSRIALDGALPLNTHGGQLSGGRTHGFGFVHEAVMQLRGSAGARQVANDPQVAVVAAGGGPMAGSMLLTTA